MVQALHADGYLVAQARSAPEALAVLETEDIDLLITDYHLGGATGTWLARLATSRAIVPRVLLVSADRTMADADGLPIVHKPVEPGALTAQVRHVLASEVAEPAPAPMQRIALTLYCSDSLRSQRARRRLSAVLSSYSPEYVALTILDVSGEHDASAELDRVLATPTLVRTFPGPRVWIVGDLEDAGAVHRMLEKAGVPRLV